MVLGLFFSLKLACAIAHRPSLLWFVFVLTSWVKKVCMVGGSVAGAGSMESLGSLVGLGLGFVASWSKAGPGGVEGVITPASKISTL